MLISITKGHGTRQVINAALLVAAVLFGGLAASAVATPARGNDYTLVLDKRAGSYPYSRTLTEGNAYKSAVAAFGRPTSMGKDAPESNICTVRWERLGIDIGFAWASGPCSRRNVNKASWSGMRLFGIRWKTERGLRVGSPVALIKRLYPRARYVSRPPRPGEWWLVLAKHPDLGLQPRLVAEAGAGRVTAIRVPPPTF